MERIQVEITNKCNLTCVMCPRNIMTRPQGFIDMALFKDICKQAWHMGTQEIYLFWLGESLLHKDIVEMVKYASACNLDPVLQTNAVLLEPELSKELFDAGLKGLGFSLDGGWDYHKVRGDNYSKVLKNIMDADDIRKKHGHDVVFTLATINFGQEPTLLKSFYLAIMMCVDKANYIPYGGQSGLKALSAEGKIIDAPKFTGKYKKCIDGQFGLVVSWDGRVTFCCGDYDIKTELGRLTGPDAKTLKQIYEETQAGIYPKLDNMQYAEIDACHDCVWCHETENEPDNKCSSCGEQEL